MNSIETRPWPQEVLLAEPRGFCAGVKRSIDAYREAVLEHKERIKTNPQLKLYSVGKPAHNQDVIDEFINDMIFVDTIDDVEERSMVLLGPHGSSKKTLEIAKQKKLEIRDTVCPLVMKVFEEIDGNTNNGISTIYFGQNGHPETEAARGWGNVVVVENREQAMNLVEKVERECPDAALAFANQTTVNADEARLLVEELKQALPQIKVPKKEDTCFATRDRQAGVKGLVTEGAQAVVVVGDPLSSNSKKLAGVSRLLGCGTFFIKNAGELKPEEIVSFKTVGVTSGASTPPEIFDEVIALFEEKGSSRRSVVVADESRTVFKPVKVQKPPYKAA